MGLYDLLLASNINGGSGKVVANPDEPATAELEKLKVGNSVYSVVTKAVDDLANYYTKSDVYTKAEVNNIAQARFAVVSELPVSDIQTNVIYLVPKSTAQTNNDYDEYIYTLKSTNPDTYGWEKIGDTEIDLSGYVTTSDLNTALADYTTTADLTTLLAGKQNTLTFDSTPTESSNNPVTSGGIKIYVDAQGAKTVSGNHITITDAEGMNADHVVSTITPAQNLHGYSKPWVGGTGKNKLPLTVDGIKAANSGATWNDNSAVIDGVTFTILTDSDGNVIGINANGLASAAAVFVFYVMPSMPNNEYIFNGLSVNGGWDSFYLFVNNVGQALKTSGMTFKGNRISNTAFAMVIASGYNAQDLYFYPMVRLSTEADATFEPYTNVCGFSSQTNAVEITVADTPTDPAETKTYTVQLGDTYYGGTLDVTRGKLTVTDGHIASYNGETLPSTWLSDRDEYAEGTTPTTGAEVVYKLATPIEIQLTPTQIELLENNNTITTNVSSLDITYQANTVIGDTASALDKRVTSLETKVPQPPTTDGTYKLTVTVASGTPTYSWESAT